MWSRSRVSEQAEPCTATPAIDDGVSLWDGPACLDWTTAETTSYRMFFPESFTPSYAYPLVLYIHDETRNEKDLERWFPRISDQNFLAAAVRAPFPDALGIPSRYSWHKNPVTIAAKVVTDALESISTLWKVHPDRVYLMGDGLGAELALELALERSLFAGAIAICPTRIPAPAPAHPPRMKKRILLFDNQCVNSVVNESLVSRGVDLTGSPTLEPGKCSRMINHWLMASLPGTVW